MKSLIKYFTLFCLAAFISSFRLAAADLSTNEKAFEDANALYKQGEFDKALEKYLAIESDGYISGTLYYNTGNAYYKLSDYARAILYYERALVLMPSDKDVQNNLEMARAFTIDKIEAVPEFIMITWFRKLTYIFSSDGWAAFSLVALAAAVAFVLTYLFGGTFRFRKASFFIACVFAALTIFSFSMAVVQKNNYTDNRSAIILSPVASVKGAPDQDGKNLMMLHEGTKVNILEDLGSWQRVELLDGRQGWIETKNIEVI